MRGVDARRSTPGWSSCTTSVFARRGRRRRSVPAGRRRLRAAASGAAQRHRRGGRARGNRASDDELLRRAVVSDLGRGLPARPRRAAAIQKSSVSDDQLDTATTTAQRSAARRRLERRRRAARSSTVRTGASRRQRVADGAARPRRSPATRRRRGRVPAGAQPQGGPRRSARHARVGWIDAAGRGFHRRRPRRGRRGRATCCWTCSVALHRVTQRAGEVLRLDDQDAIADGGALRHRRTMMAQVATVARDLDWVLEARWAFHDRRSVEAAGRRRARWPVGHHVATTARWSSVVDGVDRQRPRAGAAARCRRRRAASRRSRARRSTGWRAEVEPFTGRGRPAPPTSSSRSCWRVERAIPVLESLDQAGLFMRHAARVGAGAVSPAAQRVPPLHGRSALVGGRRRGVRCSPIASPAPTCW